MPRQCDIVMKGGITSGIVYPAAVFEIAKDFTFKNVGGTSAGAIAAALTAAAERRRSRDGATDGFDRVAAVPVYLAKENHLFRLFVPNARTRSLFRTIAGLAGRPRFQPAAVAKWCGLVWAFPFASLLGAIPGSVFFIAVLTRREPALAFAAEIVLAVGTTLAGITVAFLLALLRDLLTELPRNAYGMVTGVDDADRSNECALSTWLARELELTAGLEAGKTPLTFGMLWDAKRDAAAEGLEKKPADPDVNLEMIATNVTWGRPYQFPSDVTFYYDPEELRRFFPDHVIKWMKERPRKAKDEVEAARFAAHAPGKLPLPLASDLPVIVATRMSLAFPILLSAVPLYAADFSLPMPANKIPELERCWFADGGISSNFPVTLFDSPLPRWPTFAINLAQFPKTHSRQADESKNVYMARDNAAGLLPVFNRFGPLPGFLSAIFDAMQNWNDNTQSRLPGYRDRIVTVFLADDEGGLNLDMPPQVLERLRARGAAAGALIAGRFKTPSVLAPGKGAMDWENHRWLRFRTAMGAAKSYLADLAKTFRHPEASDVAYDALINAADGTPVHRYPIPPEARRQVDDLANRAAQLGEELGAVDSLAEDLPKPSPALVLRGNLET
ncbi:MAG: patatin-like phospholipase family protein [Candidatus Baltobacteraceae bacterium]